MSKFTLEFYDDYNPKYKNYRAIFKRIYEKTMLTLGYDRSDYLLEVSIVDEEEIQTINREYRQKDKVTDVISFAFNDEVEGELKVKNAPLVHLGAIIICAPRAIEQASEYGHDERREFKFLFVHGLLHLLGYDHETAEEEKEMFSLQDKLIGKRGKNNEKRRINYPSA